MNYLKIEHNGSSQPNVPLISRRLSMRALSPVQTKGRLIVGRPKASLTCLYYSRNIGKSLPQECFLQHVLDMRLIHLLPASGPVSSYLPDSSHLAFARISNTAEVGMKISSCLPCEHGDCDGSAC